MTGVLDMGFVVVVAGGERTAAKDVGGEKEGGRGRRGGGQVAV